MARQRIINPEFWLDNELAKLDFDARLFYIGTWNFSDDYGVIEDNPAKLKAQIFPYDGKVDAQKLRDDLVKAGKLIPFEANGKAYLHLKNFSKWQRVDKPSRFRNPPFNRGVVGEQSANTRDEEKRSKEKRSNKKPTVSCNADKPALPDPKPLKAKKPGKSGKELAPIEQAVARKDQEIFDTIELFKGINPNYERFFSNTTQRAAAARLVKKYGIAKVRDLVKLASFCNGRQYCPAKAIVHTPLEMERSMADMIDFYKREHKKEEPPRVLDLTK